MAITFEEKKSFGQMGFGILFIVGIFGIAGYYAWKIFGQVPEPILPAVTVKVKINEDVLTDSRVKNLELFPKIPEPDTDVYPRINPFTEYTEEERRQAEENKANEESGLLAEGSESSN